MDIATNSSNHRVKLSRSAAFRIGALEAQPALREVRWSGGREVLEPRVMQVLVVLAEMTGAIVGRDELFDRCWDGRIVGDNAINRVISRLRRLSEETGAFSIETVTKVGYRLVAAAEADGFAGGSAALAAERQPMAVNRRVVLGALGAVAAISSGAAWLMRSSPAREKAEAVAARAPQ